MKLKHGQRYCQCPTVTIVARDLYATCGQCGGVDAYKGDIDGRKLEAKNEAFKKAYSIIGTTRIVADSRNNNLPPMK